MTIIYWLAVLLVLLALWLTGRWWSVREINNHTKSSDAVIAYHNDLVQYADSRGADREAMQRLMLSSTKVEGILGSDNWISGATVVKNIFNGVPAVPFAIRAIHESIGDYLWQREVFQAVELVRNILIRHVGRRNDEVDQLVSRASNPFWCIAQGWKLWSAIPLYLLNGLGLIKTGTVKRARNSLAFALYSTLLFLAALAGPALAYLADKNSIDAQIQSYLRR